MIESYPHKSRFYCGAVCAGSGNALFVACHGPIKEVASACLGFLLADLRSLMHLCVTGCSQHMSSSPIKAVHLCCISFVIFSLAIRCTIDHLPYTPHLRMLTSNACGAFVCPWPVLCSLTLVLAPPSIHSFSLQTANWICNRLPSASRLWHSPYYILSRTPCSIAYLRSLAALFACLCPGSIQRQGDRHFSDRGALGVYLGPSETSPASVTYVPSRCRLLTSRHVVFYEDVHPGVRAIDSTWHALEEGNSTTQISPSQAISGDSLDLHSSSDIHNPLLPPQRNAIVQTDTTRDTPTSTSNLASDAPAFELGSLTNLLDDPRDP